MLRSAPKFYEVAKRIIEITEGCILVAHNASFDYRILRTEFNRLGYDFKVPTLCTVELSKKLILDQPSYSLGKLVRSLGIPMADRHRASGDALATVQLFKLLLAKDTEKEIVKSFVKTEIKPGMLPKLLDIVEALPSKTGIYYIHNENGDLIYIGKSKNIKKRVNQHFTGTNSKSKKIQRDVYAVTYEETGSELIALLKESEEIKVNKPIYNRAQRKSIFQYALYSFKDEKGYLALRVEKADGRKKEITSFTSLQEGKNALFRITEKYHLCQKINGLYETKNACFQYKIKECNGACIGEESPEIYNEKVNEFLAENSFENQNMVIVDRGRTHNERSAVLIENGIYKGYCFFHLNSGEFMGSVSTEYPINSHESMEIIELLSNIEAPNKKLTNNDLEIALNYLKYHISFFKSPKSLEVLKSVFK